jgi:hypothetical protein
LVRNRRPPSLPSVVVSARVRVRQIYRLSACVDRLLRLEGRQWIAERCATLDQSNGAGELAAFIEEMAYSRRSIDRSYVPGPAALKKRLWTA